MVRREVGEALYGARAAYFGGHIIINGIYLFYDCELKLQILRGELFMPILYLFVSLGATYFFMVTGKRPGYLSTSSKLNLTEVESLDVDVSTYLTDADISISIEKSDLIESDDEEEKRESVIEISDYSLSPLELKASNSGDSGEESKEESFDKSDSDSNSDDETKNRVKKLKRHYCKRCKIVQPFRTRHCKQCNACVAKFDHHCFWIGGCVGELNHRLFYAMVFLMTVEYLMVFYYGWTGLDYNSENYEKENNITDKIYSKQYKMFFSCTLTAFAAIIFSGSLFLYHTLLVLTNTTTWEVQRGTSIDYIKAYPVGFEPFNKGMVASIKAVCCHSNTLRKWIMPDVSKVWLDRPFNWRNNKYYSCC